MQNLGRTLAGALLVLVIVLPTAAIAKDSGDTPMAEIPSEYVPALRAAADGLGLSYDELTSASKDELQTLLCDKLDATPTDEVVTQARAALEEAPQEELAKLSDAEREQLMAQLPTIITQVEAQYCDDAAAAGDAVTTSDGGASGDDASSSDGTSDGGTTDAGTSDGDIPVPTRVDTGGGGAGGVGGVPAAFGALFAALFGLVGVGVTARRSGV